MYQFKFSSKLVVKCCLVAGGFLVSGLIDTKPLFAAAAVENEEALGIQLYAAAKCGTLAEAQDIVRRMREQGFDINQASCNGYRSLNVAACNGQIEILEYLIAEGISTEVRDVTGTTPLEYAVRVGNMESIRCLVGLNVNIGAGALQQAQDRLQLFNRQIEQVEQDRDVGIAIQFEEELLENFQRGAEAARMSLNYLEAVKKQ